MLKLELEDRAEQIEELFNEMERVSDSLKTSIGLALAVVIPSLGLVFSDRNLDQRETIIAQDLFKKNPGLKQSIRDLTKLEAKFKKFEKENYMLIDKIKHYKDKVKVISTSKPEEVLMLFNDCITFQKEGCQAQSRISTELIQFFKGGT